MRLLVFLLVLSNCFCGFLRLVRLLLLGNFLRDCGCWGWGSEGESAATIIIRKALANDVGDSVTEGFGGAI